MQSTTDQPRFTPLRAASAGLRFLLELVGLAAVAYWGVTVGTGLLQQVALALGGVLLVALVWGLFVAPTATRRLSDPARFGVELVVFGVGVAALFAAGRPALAGLFGLLVVASEVLVLLLGQRGEV